MVSWCVHNEIPTHHGLWRPYDRLASLTLTLTTLFLACLIAAVQTFCTPNMPHFFPTCKLLHMQGPLLRMWLPQIFPWLSLPHLSSQSNTRVSDSLLGHVCEHFCPSTPWSSHLVSFWRAVSALQRISYPLQFSCLFICSSKYLSFHYSPSSIIVGASVLFIPIVIQSQSWSLP